MHYQPQQLPALLEQNREARREAEKNLCNTVVLANVQEEILQTLLKQVHDRELDMAMMIRKIHDDLMLVESLKRQIYSLCAKTEAGKILADEIGSELTHLEKELDKLINFDVLEMSNKLYG